MTAKAFIDDAATREHLKGEENKLAERGFLPAKMDRAYSFDVYWMQPSRFGTHASLVFTSNNRNLVLLLRSSGGSVMENTMSFLTQMVLD